MFCVMVKDAVPVFTPSVTDMVCTPPGSAGTAASTLKSPLADVMRHPLLVPDVAMRLSTLGVVVLTP